MGIQSQHTNMNGDGRVFHINKEQQLERRLDKSRNFNNLNAAQYDHGLNRETWCTVERTSFAAHTRFTRKHYNEANASSVFTQSTDFVDDQTRTNLTPGQYPEKRHFPGKSNVSQQQRSFDEVEKAEVEKKQ